jgi:hypothetical protein
VKRQLLLLLVLGAACSTAAAGGFDGMSCDTDFVAALKGHKLPDGPAEASEATRKTLGLKDLGGDELDWGGAVWWKICGTAYVAIADQKAVVRDVLKIPAEPGATLAFNGFCKGGPKDKELFAVVEDKAGAADMPVKAAWIIDDAKKRFAPFPVEGVLCPRGDGIVDSWK